MAENKNQHYVPKLCLKLFSVNKENRQIGLFHLPKKLYRSNAPLKHQAKQDYFYGEDGALEDALAKIENQAAPTIKRLIETNKIPVKSTSEYSWVYTFCLIMSNRTKDVAEEMNEWTDKCVKEMMSQEKL